MRKISVVFAASLALVAVSCTTSMTRNGPEGSYARTYGAPIARRTGVLKASDGARVYYEVCGAGPAIVLVHGLGGNHAVWFQQVAHFAASHKVVTLSQRGFAPSTGSQATFDVRVLVRDLEAVMDAAGVERAVVVGQSMGGWTALAFALEHPERVETLVMADTLGGIHDEEIGRHMREVAEAAARLRAEPPPLGVHPALDTDFSRERPDLGYLYQTLSTFGSPSPDVIVKQLGRTRVSPQQLEKLSVPTLFIVGSEDELFPPSLVERAASYVEGSRVTIIEGAAHSPYFERPQQWNTALESYLGQRLTPDSNN